MPYLKSQLNFVGPEGSNAAIKFQVEEMTKESNVLERVRPDSDFVRDTLDSPKKQSEAEQAREKEEKSIAAENVAQAVLQTTKDQTKCAKDSLAVLRAIQDPAPEDKQKMEDLDQKIKELEEQEKHALDVHFDKVNKRKTDIEERTNKEQESEEAEKKAKLSKNKAIEKQAHH